MPSSSTKFNGLYACIILHVQKLRKFLYNYAKKETKGQESISDEEYYTDAELKTIEYLKEEAGDNLEPVKENNKKDSFGKKIFKSIAKKAISKTINKE